MQQFNDVKINSSFQMLWVDPQLNRFVIFKHKRRDSDLPLLLPGNPLAMFPFCILSYMIVLLDK